jgi:hypothetical protein
MEVRDLVFCVYTRVGTAAAADFDFFSQNPGKCGFQFALDGIVFAGQPLPAPVSGTIIANVKPQISHKLPIPLWLPVHCLQRTGNCRFDHKPEYVPEHCEFLLP